MKIFSALALLDKIINLVIDIQERWEKHKRKKKLKEDLDAAFKERDTTKLEKAVSGDGGEPTRYKYDGMRVVSKKPGSKSE